MRALFISVVMSLVASAASAASTAVLATPGEKPRLAVFDGRVWRCDGAVCTAAGEGRSQGLLRECARVARRFGPVAAYTRDTLTLDEASLARCNREARVR